MFTALGEATAWSSPEIVAFGAARVNALIAADPGLNKFAFGLRDTLRQAPHTLSPDEEQLLASAGSPLAGPQDIRDQLASSDIPRPTVTLSDGKTVRLDDQGYTIRRAARPTAPTARWSSTNIGRATKRSRIRSAPRSRRKAKGELFAAKARHYDSALAGALDGANLPEAVYRSLIAETNRGPARASPLFRAAGSGCSASPTWAIGTSTRRW